MGVYNKAYIYFDTNALECRHSGKSLYLSQFTVNPIYYEIEDLIRNMGLTDKVEICIPDIVWLELREHLVNHFKSEKNSMEAKIDDFRKSFGNLAEIICEFKDCRTDSEYSDYDYTIAENFLSSPRVNAKIIPSPKDEDAVQQIIQQAIHSVRPFRTAKAGGKEYAAYGHLGVEKGVLPQSVRRAAAEGSACKGALCVRKAFGAGRACDRIGPEGDGGILPVN